MEIRPRKKVSTACSHCKLRKRKCSTTLPCNNCIVNRQKCVYGEVADGRRKESIQRARLESNFHRDVLDRLLYQMRSGEDQEIISLVASDASMEEIANHLNVPSISIFDGASSVSSEPSTEVDGNEDRERLEAGSQQVYSHNQYAIPGYVEVFGNLPFSSAISSAGYGHGYHQHQVSNFRIPEHLISPLHWLESQGSMTKVIQSFRDCGRRNLMVGMSPETVLGPEAVNCEVALRRLRDDDMWTPATWAAEFQRSFERIDSVTRLASIYLMASYMRWLIAPTAENYALLPDCMRPTLAQRLIPHHAAMDMQPHPALRELMILESKEYGPECEERPDIVPLQVTGFVPGWDSDVKEAITIDPATGNRTVSRQFIDAISRMDRWRTGQNFLKRFSDMEGKLIIAKEDTIPVDDRQLHDINWIDDKR